MDFKTLIHAWLKTSLCIHKADENFQQSFNENLVKIWLESFSVLKH